MHAPDGNQMKRLTELNARVAQIRGAVFDLIAGPDSLSPPYCGSEVDRGYLVAHRLVTARFNLKLNRCCGSEGVRRNV